MAEEDYPRLAALCACGQTLKVFASSGRTAKSCNKRCRNAPAKIRPLCRVPCARCSAEFTQRTVLGMYCSQNCKKRAWQDRTGATKRLAECAALRALIKAQAAAAKLALGAERLARKQATSEAEQERLAALRFLRTCEVCAGAIGNTRARRWCSKACRKDSHVVRDRKRDDKQRRRAAMKGVAVERFNRRSIFRRDGWRCQICGVSTPEKLIGSNKPNEPTIDHIVALANGGAHAPWQVQCACRQCNSSKSAGPPRGQIGLFARLHQ